MELLLLLYYRDKSVSFFIVCGETLRNEKIYYLELKMLKFYYQKRSENNGQHMSNYHRKLFATLVNVRNYHIALYIQRVPER